MSVYNNNLRQFALVMSSPHPTQIKKDNISQVTYAANRKLVTVNYIPSVQVYNVAGTRPSCFMVLQHGMVIPIIHFGKIHLTI